MLHWYDFFFFLPVSFLNWGAIYSLPIITHVHGCVCCTHLRHTVCRTVRTGLVHCLAVPFPDQCAAVINENILICPCHFQSTWNISLHLCLCVALHPYLHMWNIMLHLCLCVTLHPYLHVMCPFTGLPLAVSSDVPTDDAPWPCCFIWSLICSCCCAVSDALLRFRSCISCNFSFKWLSLKLTSNLSLTSCTDSEPLMT